MGPNASKADSVTNCFIHLKAIIMKSLNSCLLDIVL